MSDMGPVSTPCIQICVLNPVTSICEGCGRTLDEIAQWSCLGEAERQRIMSELERRRRGASLAEAEEE